MKRRTVSVLENLLAVRGALPHNADGRGHPLVEVRKQLLITLWILGNPECLLGCRSIRRLPSYYEFIGECVKL